MCTIGNLCYMHVEKLDLRVEASFIQEYGKVNDPIIGYIQTLKTRKKNIKIYIFQDKIKYMPIISKLML